MNCLEVRKLYEVVSWRGQDGLTWYKPLTALHFAGPSGWAVGSGQIVHSNDGGRHWANQIPGELSEGLSSPQRIVAIDQHTAWLIMLAHEPAKSCYYSKNGGQHWIEKRLPLLVHPKDIFFSDDAHGWILSDDGDIPAGDAMIHLTDDGGDTWESLPLEIKGTTRRLKFLTPQFGLLIQHTANNARTRTICSLLISRDGGRAWRLVKSFNRRIDDLCILSEHEFFVVGEGGFISRTTDGGVNWKRTYTRTQVSFNTIEINGDGKGIAAGDFGLVMITTDGGKNWLRCTMDDEAGNVVDLSFVGENRVLAAATMGIYSLTFQ